MFDLSTLFISVAHATEKVSTQEPTVTSELMRFLPLFLIFVVFYFLLIRPQQKKADEQTKMLAALKKGDKVVAGGFLGTIVQMEGDEVIVLELAKGIHVRAFRSVVSGLRDESKATDNINEKK